MKTSKMFYPLLIDPGYDEKTALAAWIIEVTEEIKHHTVIHQEGIFNSSLKTILHESVIFMSKELRKLLNKWGELYGEDFPAEHYRRTLKRADFDNDKPEENAGVANSINAEPELQDLGVA